MIIRSWRIQAFESECPKVEMVKMGTTLSPDRDFFVTFHDKGKLGGTVAAVELKLSREELEELMANLQILLDKQRPPEPEDKISYIVTT